MSTPMERDAAIISAVLDHLRAERDEARTELAELKAREHTPAWELAQTARRYKRERDDARAAGEVLMRDKARDTALAGDALRDKLTEAVAAALLRTPVAVEPDITARVVAAIMPIVGRAALAAREAFPARPFTMDHTFGYTPVPAEPERELRIQRVTSAKGAVSWRGRCTRCTWAHLSGSPDRSEAVFTSHECADYPLTDNETEGQ